MNFGRFEAVQQGESSCLLTIDAYQSPGQQTQNVTQGLVDTWTKVIEKKAIGFPMPNGLQYFKKYAGFKLPGSIIAVDPDDQDPQYLLESPINKQDPLFKILESSYKELLGNQKSEARRCRKKLNMIPINKCVPSKYAIQHCVRWGDKIVSGQINENGEPDGIAVVAFTEYQDLQEGNWEQGKQHGYCRNIFADGDYWIGEYRDGKEWNVERYDGRGLQEKNFVNGEWV